MNSIFDRMLEEFDESNNAAPMSDTDAEAMGETDGVVESESLLTSPDIKQVTQELLKYGYIEESKRADMFRRTILLHKEINVAIEPLDLIVKIDSNRGIAFLATRGLQKSDEGEDDEWGHPLVRRQRLTLEQSLLIAILRQAFIMHEQESGVGTRDATIAVEDLLPQFQVYLGDSGSDAKNESRLLNLLDQLKSYGIVSEVDKKQEIIIRPLIAHLANPESLTALLQVFEEKANENRSDSTSTVGDPEC